MHRIRPFLTIPVGLIIIVLAVANRHDVAIHLFPLPWVIDVPLYALLLLTFALGVIAGALAMWTGQLKRHRKQRVKAARQETKQAPAPKATAMVQAPKTPPAAS